MSAGSITLNSGGSENDSACVRMIRCAIAWNVPPQIRSPAVCPAPIGIRSPSGPSTSRAIRSPSDATRASMSSAARRVNVSSRIRLAWMPCDRSQAARATRVPVLPVPAPASTSSGPPSWVAARRCSSFSSSSRVAGSNMHTNVTKPNPGGQLPRQRKLTQMPAAQPPRRTHG